MIEQTGYVEKVARGAFRKALSSSGDIPLLWQHDRNQLLAKTPNTLKVREDAKGLLVEAKLPKSGLGEYVREMIADGNVKGMSYGREYAPGDTTIERRGGTYYRLVTGAKRLLDVSLTWEPTYEATEVELRAGFVAVPLQELLSGVEAQTEPSGNGEQPPDDGKPDAWWGDDNPADSEGEQTSAKPRNWREEEVAIFEELARGR
jgi:HK97 family phage prohead protease